MRISKLLISTSTFFLLLAIANVTAAAQADAAKNNEANFDAMLHVLASARRAEPGEQLPASLSAVARRIKGEFGASDVRLINTYVGRLSNAGSLDYKGVSNAYVDQPQSGSPSFLDWRLSSLKPIQDGAGQTHYQFELFRFGARVPVVVGARDDASKGPLPLSYESIGLTLNRISVRENVPTLVGTLTQPKTEGTLYLILTVRNADK